MARQIPWARVFVEGAVIVASILLAFGIQAWWEQRGEALRRQAILSGLESDFRAASEDLDRLIAVHEESLAGAARLMRLTESGTVDATLGPQVDSILSFIVGGGSFFPPPGTLQTLVGTGGLDLLDNRALAQALTPWEAWVADLLREQDQNTTRVFRLMALLAEAGVDVSDLVWHESYSDVPWAVRYTDAWRVVGTPLIRSAVSDLWFGYRSTTGRQRRLRDGLDEILRHLPPA